MTLEFLFISLMSAGISALWKNLFDEPAVKKVVNRFPYIIYRAVTCGFCFTYWTTLAVLIAIKFPLVLNFISFANLFGMWMALGFLASIFYYILIVLQEIAAQLIHRHEEMHKDA